MEEKDVEHLLFEEKNLNVEDFSNELDIIEDNILDVEGALNGFQVYNIQSSDEINSIHLFYKEFFERIQNYQKKIKFS